jgi:acyl carrier protein
VIDTALKEVVEIALDREIDVLTPEMHLYDDLAMDSMGAVAMVVEFQRRFGFRIPDDEAANIRTVADLVALVQSVKKT